MEIQWSLILFTVITGAAGWGLAALAVEEVRKNVDRGGFAIALALLVVLVIGGCASVTHLSHPENMLAALSHPTSGIFVEAALIGITSVATAIYLILKRRGATANAIKGFAIAAGAFGVLLSFMAGASYVVASQPAWDTPLTPICYGLTCFPEGIALYMLLASAARVQFDSKLFGLVLGIAGVLSALVSVVWGTTSGFFSEIAGCVGIAAVTGIVAAAAGFIARSGKNIIVLAAIALLFAIAAAIAYRYGMWAVGFGINNFFGSV